MDGRRRRRSPAWSPSYYQLVCKLTARCCPTLSPQIQAQRLAAKRFPVGTPILRGGFTGLILSEYYANVPEARIGSEFFALLRHRLRQGQYKNKEKNRDRFGGLFYDIRFISTYAPYCDAMVLDSLMYEWATDPLIDLPKRFGAPVQPP